MKYLVSCTFAAFLVIMCIVGISVDVYADGDEALGTPGISIASGTGIIVADYTANKLLLQSNNIVKKILL